MQRKSMTAPGTITLILILQIVPLLLYPPASFGLASQEWWLPVLLSLMVIVADVQIIVQRSTNLNPWYLISFAQGFNIISRLMTIWFHATVTVNNVTVPNWPYVVLSVIAMGMSAFLLSYTEQPEVRMAFLPS